MSASKQTRITRDAIMVEAIAEIGSLIERVDELEEKTVPWVLDLEKKLLDIVAHIDQHVETRQVELKGAADRERQIFEEKLNASVAKTLKRMVNELPRGDGLSVKSQLRMAFGIALIASVLSLFGSYWLFGQEQEQQAAIGRALLSAWPDLDEKSKATIEQAY